MGLIHQDQKMGKLLRKQYQHLSIKEKGIHHIVKIKVIQ
jgi:hypothetical protein